MGSNFSPKEIIEKIKELNKNCIIILGNEPVVSNHIKKEIRCFSDLNNIEYKSINLDTSIQVLVSHHPAFLLKSPNYKKEAWADLQMLQKKLNE